MREGQILYKRREEHEYVGSKRFDLCFPQNKEVCAWFRSVFNPNNLHSGQNVFEETWAEINQALFSQFYFLAEFFIGRLPVKD